MSRLIHERFLLQSDEAVRLYHDYAAGQPIIDYHTHLPPAEIASFAGSNPAASRAASSISGRSPMARIESSP